MSAVRQRRVAPSSVNTPVSIKVLQNTCIDNAEAQLLLDQFLNEAERVDPSITAAGGQTSISQLKRCQRELRGLTPLMQDTVSTPRAESTAVISNSQNKKIKFDDFDSTIQQALQQPTEEGNISPEKKIDKEERKRLKKERRKEERKRKLEEE